jgi:hypothetical protein
LEIAVLPYLFLNKPKRMLFSVDHLEKENKSGGTTSDKPQYLE